MKVYNMLEYNEIVDALALHIADQTGQNGDYTHIDAEDLIYNSIKKYMIFKI